MKKVILIFLVGFVLAACVSEEVDVGTVNVNPSSTPSLPTASKTVLPSPTTTPSPVPSLTLSLQVDPPTNTPTLLPTATSQPNALCPPTDPDLTPDLTVWENDIWSKGDPLVDILNSGVAPEVLIRELSKDVQEPDNKYFLIDLTGDEIPELIVRDASLLIFGCVNGEYQTLIAYDPSYQGSPSFPQISQIEDLNNNGIPDLVVFSYASTHGFRVVEILEWDGLQFASLIRNRETGDEWLGSPKGVSLTWYSFDPSPANDEASDYGRKSVEFNDVNGDGTKELILSSELPGHPDALCTYGPWREYVKTYAWDGEYFMYDALDLAPPRFRFQAVQEGDRLSLLGLYDEAQQYYQEAVFSDQLESFSELRAFEIVKICVYGEYDASNPPSGLVDTEDYYQLAAYARYRLMLLHILRGWDSDAEIVYTTIIEKFPPGKNGHIIAEVSQQFWETYQESQDMGLACASVTEFATNHEEEILPVLGGWYHGFQSHRYTVADICPFK